MAFANSDRVAQAPAIDLSAVFFLVGVIVCAFGGAMLLPAALDIADNNSDYRVFLTCSAMTVFGGLSMALAFRRARHAMGVREVMLTVPATWLTVVNFASLPFIFSSFRLSYTDALFETMSGITATGSTVIVGLDGAPTGLLLWRWLLVWLGGFGIITLAVLVLPFLRIGGMQLFVLDLSAQAGKFVPRMIDVVGKIGLVYLGITAIGAVAFRIEGMSTFDAIGHSMAAVATGGFSSHDASIGWFKSPAIEWTVSALMVVSAMPLVLHIEALRRGPDALFEDAQVRLFLWIILGAVGSLFVWRVAWNDAPIFEAAREATFNVTSMISTTGFASQDFDQWGGFPSVVLLLSMLLGGCTGSTAGGIKMFRLCILLSATSRAGAPTNLSARSVRRHLQRSYDRRDRACRRHPLLLRLSVHVHGLRAGARLLRPVVRGQPRCFGHGVGRCRPRPGADHRSMLYLRSDPGSREVAADPRDARRSAGNPGSGDSAYPHLLAGLMAITSWAGV